LSALLSARDNLGDTVAQALPATYAVEAGRKVMDGLLCADVAGLLGTHVASGGAYLVLGSALLSLYEHVTRPRST